MQRHPRLGALVAASALLVAGALPALSVRPADAAPPTLTGPAAAAAAWLAGQLSASGSGGLVKTNGTPDYAASIDAAEALKAAGKDAVAQQSADAVAAVGTSYTEFDSAYSDGTYVGYYAGHVAKLLGLELDVPPTTTTPCHHVAAPPTASSGPTTPPAAGSPRPESTCELADKLTNAMTTDGQVRDVVTAYRADATVPSFAIPGDPQHVTQAGQAWAAYALAKYATTAPSADTAAATTAAPLALAFLLREQSAAGGFCVEQTTTACTAPDALTTAQVVLALQQMPTSTATSSAITRARTWLAGAQRSDGSFGDAVVTGEAGSALAGTYNAQLAAVWLRQGQADELAACPDALSSQTGAVSLNRADRNAGRASGIADAVRGSWERATAAAIPALVSLPARSTAPVTFTGPVGYRQGGAQLTYDAANEAPGDLVCLTTPTSLTRGWADVNGHASINLTMPNATVDLPVTLHDHTGADQQVVTRVLGPTRYSISMVTHRKRGHLFRITVYGLQPNESYYVKFRTIRITSGRAPASGTLTVPYTIRRKAKVGMAKVTVVGQTGDRYGVKFLRVTR